MNFYEYLQQAEEIFDELGGNDTETDFGCDYFHHDNDYHNGNQYQAKFAKFEEYMNKTDIKIGSMNSTINYLMTIA